MRLPSKQFILSFFILLGLSFLAAQTPVIAESQTWGYKPPIEPTTWTDLFKSILNGIQALVGYLAVAMIVFGGLVYITSGGRNSQLTWAKDIITLAMIGFAIAVAAPSIVKEIQDLAAGSGSGTTDGGSLKDIVIRVMNFLLIAVGLLGGIGFVIGGALYATAMGDQNKADSGKKAVYYSLMAIAISGAGVILIKQILSLIGGTST